MATPAADQGLPLQLGPGRLTIGARLADDDVGAPTVLVLRSDHNADPGANVEMTVSGAGDAVTVDLAGGVYSFKLHVNAPTPDNATLADVAHEAQFVALQIAYERR